MRLKILILSSFFITSAFAQNSYNGANNQLSLPSVKVGNTIYTDVVITVGQVLSVGSSYEDTGASFNLKQAYENSVLSSQAESFTISGEIEGANVSGTGTLTQGGFASTFFEGKSARSKTLNISMNLIFNGQSFPFITSSDSYYDLDNRPLGSDGDGYEVVTLFNNLPSQAGVNHAGLAYRSTIYKNSSKSVVEAYRTATYSTNFESAGTIILTLITIDRDQQGNVSFTSSTRYRVFSDNSVDRLGETAYDSTSFLTITYQ